MPSAVTAAHVVGGASLVGNHAGEDASAAVVHFGLVGYDPFDRESVRDEPDGDLLE